MITPNFTETKLEAFCFFLLLKQWILNSPSSQQLLTKFGVSNTFHIKSVCMEALVFLGVLILNAFQLLLYSLFFCVYFSWQSNLYFLSPWFPFCYINF